MVGFLFLSYMVGAVIHAVRADRFPRSVAPVPSPPVSPPAAPLVPPLVRTPVGPGFGPPTAPAPAPPPQPPPAAPPAGPTATDHPRMRQVASGLDELGECLPRQEGR